MSNISTNSPRIMLSHKDSFPLTLETYYEDLQNLVDTETIPNYAGEERNRVFFSATEWVKPLNRRIKGLVAIPFGMTKISFNQLNDWADFVALRGLPYVAAVSLPNLKIGPLQNVNYVRIYCQTYIYPWIGERVEYRPTPSVWEALSLSIGIRAGGSALKETVMDIWKKAAISVREVLGDRFYDFALIDGKKTEIALEHETLGKTGYEASVLYHATKLLPDGDPILAQAIMAWLRRYFNIDFIIITPEGMAATTDVVTMDCCAIQWLPRERTWTAFTRSGPVSTLRRVKDFEGNPAEFEPQFERFLRFHELSSKKPKDIPDWATIDNLTWSNHVDMKNKVPLGVGGPFLSLHMGDIVHSLPSVGALVTQQVAYNDRWGEDVYDSIPLMLMHRVINLDIQERIVPLVGKCCYRKILHWYTWY